LLGSDPLEEFTMIVLKIPAGGTVYESQLLQAKYDPDMNVNCRAMAIQ
jgi:hypothetical protein